MRRVLVLAFIVVPLAELALIVWLGERINYLNTLGLLLGVSILGAVLAKREGLAAWRRLVAAIQAGQIPSDEIFDGALVLVGAALLLTPGFITDAIGLAFLLPTSRPPVKRAGRWAARRFVDARMDRYRPQTASRGPAGAHRVEVVRVTPRGEEQTKSAKNKPDEAPKSD